MAGREGSSDPHATGGDTPGERGAPLLSDDPADVARSGAPAHMVAAGGQQPAGQQAQQRQIVAQESWAGAALHERFGALEGDKFVPAPESYKS